MIDQDTFESLMPVALDWAKIQEQFILERGAPLTRQHIEDAQLVGVKDWSRVRVLVVDRIPMPENRDLAEAARQTHIITTASRGMTVGHGIVIRADAWGNRELMLHQLVHVAQCERSGSLEAYVQQYLFDRRNCAKFTIGSLEEEARRVSHEICNPGSVAL